MAVATTSSTPAATALATIATSPSLPPRVRRILDVLFVQMSRDLTERINRMLVDVDQQLFHHAERAPSNDIQSLHFANMSALKRSRDRFLPHFMAVLEHEVASIREPRLEAPASPSTKKTFSTLTLVENADMDKDVVLREIFQRHEVRAHTGLHLLGQRFGVLAGSSALEVDRLPIGPQALCRALRNATPALEIDLDTQLMLYKAFDQKVMAEYTSWVQVVDQLLSQQGVLPGLVFAPKRSRGKASTPVARQVPDQLEDANSQPVKDPDIQPPRDHQPTRNQPSPARPSFDPPSPGSPSPDRPSPDQPSPDRPSPDQASPDRTSPYQPSPDQPSPYQPSLDQPSPYQASPEQPFPYQASPDQPSPDQPSPARWPNGRMAARMGGDDEPTGHGVGNVMQHEQGSGSAAVDQQSVPSFEALQQLLDGRRKHNRRSGDRRAGSAPAAAGGGAASALSTANVLTNLRALQALPVSRKPGQQRRTMSDVQDAMLQQARLERGPDASLLQEDTDTFELLGLLYDEIEREVHTDAPAGELLVQLQVPLAQAALQDREFFLRAQNPARDLLNSVAESGARWLGNDDTDPVLMRKLQDAVDRVMADYHGDGQVFETVNNEVQGHFKAMAHKAELTARRHVEAAMGKDRLEVAKRRAEETIQAALADKQPPKFVQSLLSQAWADVLTMNLLRNGEDAKEWRDSVELTERIALITSARPEEPPEPDEALTNEIEQSLAQLGYHKDESEAIARRLSGAPVEEETESRTELAAKLKSRQRPGEQTPPQKKITQPPRSRAEQKCHAYLLTLPFGTWFEFVVNQQGEKRRQQMAWFSPVTDNALFVNQRGQRIGEQSLDSVARLMACDQVCVVSEGKGRLIDRAWQATVKALRNFAGSGPQGVPA